MQNNKSPKLVADAIVIARMGMVAYQGYCENTGWKSIATGDTLPPWELLHDDIKSAWMASAVAITKYIGILEGNDELGKG